MVQAQRTAGLGLFARRFRGNDVAVRGQFVGRLDAECITSCVRGRQAPRGIEKTCLYPDPALALGHGTDRAERVSSGGSLNLL